MKYIFLLLFFSISSPSLYAQSDTIPEPFVMLYDNYVYFNVEKYEETLHSEDVKVLFYFKSDKTIEIRFSATKSLFLTQIDKAKNFINPENNISYMRSTLEDADKNIYFLDLLTDENGNIILYVNPNDEGKIESSYYFYDRK